MQIVSDLGAGEGRLMVDLCCQEVMSSGEGGISLHSGPGKTNHFKMTVVGKHFFQNPLPQTPF